MAETVTIDGVEYEVYVRTPSGEGCPNMLFHYHDEPHEDGSPGTDTHHHHADTCNYRTALLLPVSGELLPPLPVVYRNNIVSNKQRQREAKDRRLAQQ